MGHYFYKKDVRYPALLMGFSIILTVVPMYFVINMDYRTTDGGSIATASAMTFLAGLLSIFPIPIERAILTNVTLPETRGRANSFLSIIDDLGKGLGPFLLSRMISSLGRTRAFNLSLIGWLIGGTVSLGMFWTVSRDEEMIQEKIQEKLTRKHHENCLSCCEENEDV
jgi:MFS-type transporter involved in bile tolerance (Atg22 family)